MNHPTGVNFIFTFLFSLNLYFAFVRTEQNPERKTSESLVLAWEFPHTTADYLLVVTGTGGKQVKRLAAAPAFVPLIASIDRQCGGLCIKAFDAAVKGGCKQYKPQTETKLYRV